MRDIIRDRSSSTVAFNNTLLPLLKAHGWTQQSISNMIYRINFGKNYRNWSIRIDNTITASPAIEAELGSFIEQGKWMIQAFINKGIVLSYGIITFKLLSEIIMSDTYCENRINTYEFTRFRVLSFDTAKTSFGNLCFIFQ